MQGLGAGPDADNMTTTKISGKLSFKPGQLLTQNEPAPPENSRDRVVHFLSYRCILASQIAKGNFHQRQSTLVVYHVVFEVLPVERKCLFESFTESHSWFPTQCLIDLGVRCVKASDIYSLLVRGKRDKSITARLVDLDHELDKLFEADAFLASQIEDLTVGIVGSGCQQ